MLQNDEKIELLMDLELTSLTGENILSTRYAEKAEVKKISTISKHIRARQDVYRIMPTLEKLGLAEKINSNTNIIQSYSLERGAFLLFQKRANKNTTLKEKIKLISNNDCKGRNINAINHEENTQFIITSDRNLFFKKMEKSISEAHVGEKWILPSTGIEIMFILPFSTAQKSS